MVEPSRKAVVFTFDAAHDPATRDLFRVESPLCKAEVNPYHHRFWRFLLWTGGRRSEALNLCWQDIQWEPHPLARVLGKRDRERWIPLLPEADLSMGPRQDLGPVWPHGRPDTWTRWFKRTARAAGLDTHRLHDLRHTAIVYMLSRESPPEWSKKSLATPISPPPKNTPSPSSVSTFMPRL